MILPDGYLDVPAGKIAAVVTSLQMFARPVLRPDPPAARWRLRHVERPGLEWYRDLFRRVGEDWLWFSRLVMPDEALKEVLHRPQTEIHALEADGRDEGLLELNFRPEEECELAFFGVTARLLGRGAGRWLMNRAIEQAWARPLKRFWVHTCTLDHPGALEFYVRSGFVPYRRQVEVADDPRLTGKALRTAARQIPMI